VSSLVYLLDTNTVSYLINARSPAARKRLAAVQDHASVAVSAITETEIRYSLEKKPGTRRLREDFEDFCAAIEVFSWNSAAAQGYAKLRTQMESSGRSLHVMDMLIAAHALAVGAVLVTGDKALWQTAPAIQVENWATDIL